MKFLQYLAYNSLLTGILVASYFLNVASLGGTIVGIFYGIFAISLGIMVLTVTSDFSRIEPYIDKLKDFYWKIPFELLFIAVTIYFGFPKIALCMIFEFASIIYLCLVAYNYKKKGDVKIES